MVSKFSFEAISNFAFDKTCSQTNSVRTCHFYSPRMSKLKKNKIENETGISLDCRLNQS